LLVQKEASTEDQLEQRSRDYETAKARFRQIESRLQDRLILAPFTGVVGLRDISVGALVEPGDIITTLDDDTIMKLDFAVPAIHLSTLKMGLTVEATAPSYGKQVFNGKVSGISSRIDETTRSLIVRAVLPNPERLLKPGMLMSVELLKNPRKALVIPEEALLPMGSSNYVLVVDPAGEQAVAEKRLVQLGSRRPGEVEIVEGLNAGDFVVIHGALKARPGQPVHIVAVKTGEETLEQLLSQKAENKKQ
jgi:membrane fusion protein (multidrug efflux system)